VQAEVHQLSDEFPAQLASEWESFVVHNEGSFFQTPTWAIAWWSTIGNRPQTQVRFWRDSSGKLTAVASRSMVSERLHRHIPIPIPYNTNTGTGAGGADDAGWCTDGTPNPQLIDWMTESSGLRPALLQNVDIDSVDGLDGEVLGQTVCPRLDIAAFRDASIGSSKLRKQVRYNRERLAKDGVELVWHPPGSVTPELLDSLVALHNERRDMMGDATTFTSERLALHRALSARSSATVGTAAIEARKDGNSVAILYGLRCGSTFSYYQSGWDPALAQFSVGSVLIGESIVRAGENGADVYDFLRGPEKYKYRFGAVDRVDVDLLFGTGPIARVLKYKRAMQEARNSEATSL